MKENVPCPTKCNHLLHRKKFFVQLKKDGDVRPVGDLTVAALRSYWPEVRPLNDDISGISLRISLAVDRINHKTLQILGRMHPYQTSVTYILSDYDCNRNLYMLNSYGMRKTTSFYRLLKRPRKRRRFSLPDSRGGFTALL